MNRTRVRIRRWWMLALLLLGSNLLLALVFYFILQVQAARDPGFAPRFEEVQRLYAPDPQDVTEASLETYYEAMGPLYAHVDWFQVALLSSVLSFTGLGMLAARLRIDPRWMGALPLATMLSGPNPAVLPGFLENQGLPGHHLELQQQVAILGVQTVVLYLVAYLTSKPPKSP